MHVDAVSEDDDSGRSDVEVETDNRLAASQLEPVWGDSMNNTRIGRILRLELDEVERRGAWEPRMAAQPVLDSWVLQEREIFDPSHGKGCVMM